MRHTFVLSDETLNSHGFRVMTEGIDLTDFLKNPIMLWMHKRPHFDDVLPIGRWENVRKEDGKLIADAVFDTNDEFAKSIERKVSNGFLRMASAGLEPLEYTDDPSLILPGQSRATLVRSTMVEASIVDIGSNKNAVKLYSKGLLVTLSSHNEGFPIPKIKRMAFTDLINLGAEGMAAFKKTQPKVYAQLYAKHYGVNLSVGDPDGYAKVELNNISSFEQLKCLGIEAVETFKKDHPQRYWELYRASIEQ